MYQRNITYLLFMLFFLFVIACNNSQSLDRNNLNDKNTFFNLDFEIIKNDGSPKNWYTGGEGYKVEIDSIEFYSGKKSLRISKVTNGKFGVATSTFPIEEVKGKHITYSGWIKTENIITGNASLWWRVDGKKEALGFDDMHNTRPSGSTQWTQYKIEMDIDEDATNINFGVLLSGNGTAWFDNLKILIDGEEYKQTTPEPFIPTSEQLLWLKQNVIPLKTSDPTYSSMELQSLKSIINNGSIISLGEGTHGTSEFFKMKHRITKYAAEEFGNIVFAIEANMPEARRVNDYILYGKGDAKTALAGLYFWTWNTQEVLDMIEWMREYNTLGKGKIEFWGFDMQFPKVAVDNVNEFIKKYDSVYLNSLISHYTIVDSLSQKIMKRSPREINDEAEIWYGAAIHVLDHLLSNRDHYLRTNDTSSVDFVIQDARIVVQGAEKYIQGKQSRDESMALNVEWIKNHIAKDKKMVLWAHNGHVSKSRGRMGNFLNQKYGANMVVFGFAFFSGEYTAVGKNGLGTYTTSLPEQGSIEWILHETGLRNMILDLRNVEDMNESSWLNETLDFRSIGSMAMDYAFFPTEISKEYDVLIFFDETTHSKLLPREKEANK